MKFSSSTTVSIILSRAILTLISNIDRQFAIWQALNPNSYAIDKNSGSGTFSITSGTQETSTTPLTPFNNATGKAYWTSETVRNTSTFNYAYPETQQWRFPTVKQYQTSVLAAVQTLYGATSNQFMQLMGVQTASVPQQVVTGGSNASQKPMDDDAASSSNGHNFLSNLLHHNSSNSQAEVTARGGDDFESEIGKCEFRFNIVTNHHSINSIPSIRNFFKHDTNQIPRVHCQYPCS